MKPKSVSSKSGINKQIKNLNSGNSKKISRANKTKELVMTGNDYLASLRAALPNELDDGVKLIFSRQISPSMFPQTKLQATSRTFQKFKFLSLEAQYKPQIPDSVNGVLIAYFDTDPSDKTILANKENLLRLAKSHQMAVQVSINKSFKAKMPIVNTDDLLFTGNEGDERLTRQGTLYIYQVGTLTNFGGDPITKPLDIGILSIQWKCVFSSPQMTKDLVIYDGVSQKDVIRTFKNLTTYADITVSGITHVSQLAGTRFRFANLPLLPSWLNKGGVGSYMIVRLPKSVNLSNSVKAIHSLAEPYTHDKYSTTLESKLISGKFNASTLTSYIEQAFQIVKEGIKVAKLVYDVTTIVAGLFVKDATIGTLTNVTYANDIDSSSAFVPVGINVVHWDGINVPRVQDLIEFQDAAHAADSAVTVTYPLTFLFYKLEEPLIKGEIVQAALPALPPN